MLNSISHCLFTPRNFEKLLINLLIVKIKNILCIDPYIIFIFKLCKLFFTTFELLFQWVSFFPQFINFAHKQLQNISDFVFTSTKTIYLCDYLLYVVLFIAYQFDDFTPLTLVCWKSDTFFCEKIAMTAICEIAMCQLKGIIPGFGIWRLSQIG